MPEKVFWTAWNVGWSKGPSLLLGQSGTPTVSDIHEPYYIGVSCQNLRILLLLLEDLLLEDPNERRFIKGSRGGYKTHLGCLDR